MVSTLGRTVSRRTALLLAATAALAGCAAEGDPPGPRTQEVTLDADAFIMSDGARLPYRAWLPDGRPEAVVLALHGFNDSRDAWVLPAPRFAAAGYALYAPDQRGFGAAPGRGLWPGSDALAQDAADMARLLRRRHPGSKLVLMGESMGGAVLMRLASLPIAPSDAFYVLSAPAVWARSRMNPFLRATLWLMSTLVPGLRLSRPPPGVRIVPTDNRAALEALSRDPLTIHATRADTTRGLVDLMDKALEAARTFTGPGLFLYGAHDDLIPKPAMRAAWRRLPPAERRAYYRTGYHLLLRDLHRDLPTEDIIAWIAEPAAPLPSGADHAAVAWLRQADA